MGELKGGSGVRGCGVVWRGGVRVSEVGCCEPSLHALGVSCPTSPTRVGGGRPLRTPRFAAACGGGGRMVDETVSFYPPTLPSFVTVSPNADP